MSSERIDFPGRDGQRLAARLDRPAGPARAFALFAHCFTCGKDSKGASHIARALAARGIATLRFDFTGLGGSEGEFGNSGFSANVEDLIAAADWLRAEHAAPAIMVGHSLGGAAVLAAAGDVPECRAVATIGAPAETEHTLRHLGEAIETIEAEGEATVNLGGRPFRVQRRFLEDFRDQRLEALIADLRRPLLVLHAPTDRIVGVDHARRIFEAAKHPKSYVSLDDADHLLTRSADADYAAGVIAAWAARYLPEPEAAEDTAGEEGEVVVSETGEGDFQQRVLAAGHSLIADEPRQVGGLGSGPGPYDLLLAALGTCTAMTLRMYARHKQLPLEHVTVRLAHDRIHARDCEDCETREGQVDRITRQIELRGELTAPQRERLLQIADRCPVHRTLHSEIRVLTELAEGRHE
ncbi:bifunctional alpha/beta hydrolase/OsmC family protein [Spiribacter halobius]|uniref:Osmotically inducible protein C n=1 Tax=Sediminicurvatus halobius TaxID=2182432 RepID=A0A2U2N5Y0_9GAMM|nr:alpha/beta fold hydrolase [Spiribacter halobius]PWG64635.1 osmotically inducible protein C [Spiribacter halobius]UEX79041.1 alpha/beta fold hydrolase [Spiribacter halobius]